MDDPRIERLGNHASARQRFGTVGIRRLHTRKRAERELHAEQRVEQGNVREGSRSRSGDDQSDRVLRAFRMKDGTRQQREPHRRDRRDDRAVEQAPVRGERVARRFVHLVDDELCPGQHVRQDDAAVLDTRLEEPPVRAPERVRPRRVGSVEPFEGAARRQQLSALTRHRVVPEGARTRLEPRVVRPERPGPMLEGLMERAHPLGARRCSDPRHESLERKVERGDRADRRGSGGDARKHARKVGLFDAGRNGHTRERMQNRVFFAQESLDLWLADAAIELTGTELTIAAEARRYRLAEAAHIVREVTGSPDAHELIGRVKSIHYLEELGAEVMQGSMILGDNAYDIVPGFMATPLGTFEEFVESAEHTALRDSMSPKDATSDEELLKRFAQAYS